jgi:hypothetical protein
LSFAAPPAAYPADLQLDKLYSFVLFGFHFTGIDHATKLAVSCCVAFCACALWGGVFMFLILCVGETLGMKPAYAHKLPMMSTWVSVLSSSLYMVVLPKFLQLFDCTFDPTGQLPPLLVVLPHNTSSGSIPPQAMVCWEGPHLVLATFGLLAATFYVLSALIFAPFFMEDFTGRSEILFTVKYQLLDRVLKTAVVMTNVFLSRWSFEAYLIVVAITGAIDSLYLHCYSPCSLRWFARLKSIFSRYIAIAALCSLIAYTVEGTGGTKSYTMFTVLGIIFVVLLLEFGVYICLYNRKKKKTNLVAPNSGGDEKSDESKEGGKKSEEGGEKKGDGVQKSEGKVLVAFE